jgi:hypothetical protein
VGVGKEREGKGLNGLGGRGAGWVRGVWTRVGERLDFILSVAVLIVL